ncbi:hypothetical protein OKW39_005647 [Paraburkholderia sp. MM6662-R1]
MKTSRERRSATFSTVSLESRHICLGGADGQQRVGKEHSNFSKAPFAVDKFQRKSNGCCGTEVKTFRSVGGRPWNVECLSNT